MSKNTKQREPIKPLGHLSPAASRLARRAGGYTSVARLGAETMSARLRDGRMEAARRAVDPDGVLTPEDREQRAEAHVQAQRCRSLSRAQQAKAERKAAQERREARRARTPEGRARAAADAERRETREARQSRQQAYWFVAEPADEDESEDDDAPFDGDDHRDEDGAPASVIASEER